MTVPIATTVIRVEQPGTADSYEQATYTTLQAGIRAHIGRPAGFERLQSGSRENVVWRLDADPIDFGTVAPATCRVVDEMTGEEYQIVWAKQRVGLGLDHVEAELRQTKGVAA